MDIASTRYLLEQDAVNESSAYRVFGESPRNLAIVKLASSALHDYLMIDQWEQGGLGQFLMEELADLDDAVDEAEELDYELPTKKAIARARWLLFNLHRSWQRPIGVSATPYGEIALHMKVQKGSSVMFVCEADGGVLFLTNFGGEQESYQYDDSDKLPNQLVLDSLLMLERRLS